MCPSRFVWVCRAILAALLQKALIALEPRSTQLGENSGFYEELLALNKVLKTVYQFLNTLIGQVRRIHYLLLGMFNASF